MPRLPNVRDPLPFGTSATVCRSLCFVDLGMASWKWAEMMADLYEREGFSHAQSGDCEPSPL